MQQLIQALICCALLTSTQLYAEVLRIPISQQGTSTLQMPARGEQQTQVLQQFGEPQRRHSSVGQPPITRWDYPDFSVYFEQSTVVNSVQLHQAKHPVTP